MPLCLETPRLILRTFEERDAAPLAAYRSDPEVARYQGWEAPFSPGKSRAVCLRNGARAVPGAPGEWYQLAIELKSGGAMIGDFAFKVSRWDSHQAEIGYTLAGAYQGRGYASEALSRLLDYLFTDFNLHRVHANIDPENIPSARLCERAGMRHEGRFVQSLWFKGRWASEDWYAIASGRNFTQRINICSAAATQGQESLHTYI